MTAPILLFDGVCHLCHGVVRFILEHESAPTLRFGALRAMAVRLGLPDDVGMLALTINPARFVGIENRVGSLEVGKDADLVFWSGDPIDPRNHVETTVVNGNIAYRRDARRPRF